MEDANIHQEIAEARASGVLTNDHVDTRLGSVSNIRPAQEKSTTGLPTGANSQGHVTRANAAAPRMFGSFMEIDIKATAGAPGTMPQQPDCATPQGPVAHLKTALRGGSEVRHGARKFSGATAPAFNLSGRGPALVSGRLA